MKNGEGFTQIECENDREGSSHTLGPKLEVSNALFVENSCIDFVAQWF